MVDEHCWNSLYPEKHTADKSMEASFPENDRILFYSPVIYSVTPEWLFKEKAPMLSINKLLISVQGCTDSGVKRTGFEIWHLLAMWPRANHLTSLSLGYCNYSHLSAFFQDPDEARYVPRGSINHKSNYICYSLLFYRCFFLYI